MGQEIDRDQFSEDDFRRFAGHLEAETRLLGEWLEAGAFLRSGPVAGFELEAWLVDGAERPAPVNEDFLARSDPALTTYELARFNVELNASPRPLVGHALELMHRELAGHWAACEAVAKELGAGLVMTGILPSVRCEDLGVHNMSPLHRYRALNEQVIRLRQGHPMVIDIQGRDHLRLEAPSVMLEAATTSFQIHLQVTPAEAVRVFNAALVLSAPMVAVSANAPYLFGHQLWEETRIPLFEQAVDTHGPGAEPRVCFGSGYAERSLLECFQENLRTYVPILPIDLPDAPQRLPHLRLHNGTIWRWNRPLIGWDEAGNPHLRIEHRVVPAGPTVTDMIANAALFYGLVHHYARVTPAPERQLDFATARANFYAAAREGLGARVHWLGGAEVAVDTLLREALLPAARAGLAELGVDPGDAAEYLGVIEARVASGRTGAAWQRAWVARHGPDMGALTAAYRRRQGTGKPVHEWDLS